MIQMDEKFVIDFNKKIDSNARNKLYELVSSIILTKHYFIENNFLLGSNNSGHPDLYDAKTLIGVEIVHAAHIYLYNQEHIFTLLNDGLDYDDVVEQLTCSNVLGLWKKTSTLNKNEKMKIVSEYIRNNYILEFYDEYNCSSIFVNCVEHFYGDINQELKRVIEKKVKKAKNGYYKECDNGLSLLVNFDSRHYSEEIDEFFYSQNENCDHDLLETFDLIFIIFADYLIAYSKKEKQILDKIKYDIDINKEIENVYKYNHVEKFLRVNRIK